MNLTQKTLSNTANTKVVRKSSIVENVKKQQSNDRNIATEELTRGQRLADKLASQVGSWGFLIGQSAILAGWVGINSNGTKKTLKSCDMETVRYGDAER